MSEQEVRERLRKITESLRYYAGIAHGYSHANIAPETLTEAADLIESILAQQAREKPEPLTTEDDTRNGFFALITAERAEQDRKWGYPQLNTLCEWASYLAEECGEAIKEMNDLNFGQGSKDKLVEELVHTAAMCLAVLQQYAFAVDVTKKKRDYVYATDQPTLK